MADRRDLLETAERRLIATTRRNERILRAVHTPDTPATGRAIVLGDEELSFGRGTRGPTSFDDARMSRTHFRVSPRSEGVFVVECLGAKNGTFLGGRRLTEPRQLLPNDVISAGDTLLVCDAPPPQGDLPSVAGAGEEADTIDVAGISSTAERLRASLVTVAGAKGAVLLLGPTGVGKEIAARALHAAGGRAGKLVAINCAAIPSELAESELFGHVRGAFTGAERDRAGCFVEADGGTLFLDEVGELPTGVQAKLLRVLEDATIQPLGGGEPRTVDVRIIAATCRRLEGTDFRDDLLARLGDWVLRIPPLAARKADILHLFARFAAEERPGGAPALTAELAEALLLHDWPANVRELRKLAHRMVHLSRGAPELDIDLLPEELEKPLLERLAEEAAAGTGAAAEGPGKRVLEAALTDARGNLKLAAERNGWHRTQLYRWLSRAGIDPKRYR